ncbi:MAG: ABC transporter ATP-binding protein [Chitinivibrionales bacterium]|nr:ABC transporter ATP-binding protein [Chitinivibrionales bacterium]
MALLVLRQITKIYHKEQQQITALAGIDLEIETGEFLSIVGPSGSGKSTLLNIIGCLDTPTSGSVLYTGHELGTLTERDLSHYRKSNIAFIFQSYNLIAVLTVRENIELPLVIEKKYTRKEIEKRSGGAIEMVGLSGLANRYPRELSGGQEQRVAIARALVKQPLVVLADEPTANLDSGTASDIITVMQTMNQQRQTTFIFSTHDPLVEKHGRRRIVLKDGRIHSDERREP